MLARLVFIVYLMILIQVPCFSENKQRMDSLKVLLQKAKHDTIKLRLYIGLGIECDLENNLTYAEPAILLANKILKQTIPEVQREEVIKYKITALNIKDAFQKSMNKDSYNPFNLINELINFANELQDTTRLVDFLLRKSTLYHDSLNLPKALETIESALYLADLSNNKKGLSSCLTRLGLLYESQFNYNQALEKYQQSLKIRYLLKDSNLIGNNLSTIGSLYGKLKNIPKSIEYFKMALNYYDIYGDITIHNSLGFVYLDLQNYDSALESFNLGLELSKITGNPTYLWGSYSNIARSYMLLNDIKNAAEYYKLAMEFAKKSGISWVGWTHQSLAEFYFNQKDFKTAKINAEKSLEILNSYPAKYIQYRSLYKTLAKIDSANGNWQSAYINYQKYIELNNKSNSDELRKAAIKDKFHDDYNKQKAIEKAKQDKKDALTKIEGQRKNTILIFVIIGFILVLIFATFIYRSLSIRKKQNRLIENQKAAIESSYKNLALLNNISNEITSSLNLTSVMELIYKNVSALMDVSFFIISTYDNSEDAVEVKFCVNQNEVVPLNFKTYLSDPKSILTALTVRNKKEIIIQDWENEYCFYQTAPAQLKDKNDLYCDSMIWIPLLIKDQVIGLFSVQSIKKNAFTPANIEILRSLSSIIAVALNNAEAYHKIDAANLLIQAQKDQVSEKNKSLEESFNNIEIISKIGQKITSTLNLQEVIEGVFDYLNTVMDAQGFSVYLYNHENQTLNLKYGNEKYKFANADTISMEEKNSFGVWCIKNKKEVFINDIENEYINYVSNFYWHSGNDKATIQSFINIPLFIKEETIGFISIHSFNKNAYSKSHLEVFKSLSSYVAVALNNAEAYHKIDTAKAEVTAQKNIVEEKQKEILDSIEYALRIQTAILPPQKLVKQHLENSFILYKPKDIVAGDFYWMEVIQFENEKQFENLKMKKDKSNFQIEKSSNSQIILFAACDCTGHGVPGAMVSVVCHNALNRAVREFGLTKPSDILDKTQEIVLENFSKSEEDIKDGMDISLCALNFNKVQDFVKVELQWAGANNPLWLIHKREFIETKADKQPIGMNEDSKAFTNHSFELFKGDTIYIFSDGFADQFSPADKKLMKKNFKNLLLSIHDKNMQEQHEYLNNYIENWKGNMEQTDDILVIGVRV